MIGKEEVIKINLPCLITINEIPIRAIDRVESKSGKIHSYEVEIHSLNTEYKG